MRKRVNLIWVLLLLVPLVGQAQQLIELSVSWDPPDTMEPANLDPSTFVDHYTVYVCDSPILAGGEQADDPMIDSPTCVGNLMTIKSPDVRSLVRYQAKDATGTLYVRVSAVTKYGQESRLMEEVSYAYSFERTGPPRNGKIEANVTSNATMMLRK